jgi:phosphoribosyl-dephospho-CoA transferase
MASRDLIMNAVQPHDLMRLTDVYNLALGSAPLWVRDELARTPWVVARRSPATAETVAVGVRGSDRALRYALDINRRHIDSIVRPEQLVHREPSRDMPVFRELRRLRSTLTGLRWGPAGSTGFELATGATTVTENSDLDLVVRLDSLSAATVEQLQLLHAEFALAEVRIDGQLQLPAGAVALSEFIGTGPHILLRTEAGPRLACRRELVA